MAIQSLHPYGNTLIIDRAEVPMWNVKCYGRMEESILFSICRKHYKSDPLKPQQALLASRIDTRGNACSGTHLIIIMTVTNRHTYRYMPSLEN